MASDKRRPPTQDQVRRLASQGCTADDWSQATIDSRCDMADLRNCHFRGSVSIGKLAGCVKDVHGIEKPCGIYNATVVNCNVSDAVRIANVGVGISNYDIGDGVCIEDVGAIHTNAGATFGNGISVEALNEAGGREVIIFDELNSQFAYLTCLHRYRPKMIENLNAIANGCANKVRSDRGTIGDGARICSVKEIIDVRIGAAAVINGAGSIVNGTILSEADAPTIIGTGVIAHNFIISEGCSVTGQAILDKVFIGQGCLIGEQFSAKNSLFFANCEGFHGEACSVFAGPYTVTHHKSTLLIAVLLSFYNAGSGTNQSNHMYKLGPIHEGKLLRGTKTGSFSYMMWPSRTGPFSVVLGKHTGTFDVEDYPFSHLEARADGRASFIPGLHITSVGAARDAAKWPRRDRRKGKVKRDRISFDVLSPYTVGKMLKANVQLQRLQETTDKSVEEVSVGGALVKRPILRTSQKYYRSGIETYLLEKVVERLESRKGDSEDFRCAFACEPGAIYSEKWVDIGGELMGEQRLKQLQDEIETGDISTIEQFYCKIDAINRAYAGDEWLWVKTKFKEYFGGDLDSATEKEICDIADRYLQVKSKYLRLVIADAEKEFAELSRTGYGQDGGPGDEEHDFIQVRGLFEKNKFVADLKESIENLKMRTANTKSKLLRR
jgi:hypothetical protein